jgi:hypothetical protein
LHLIVSGEVAVVAPDGGERVVLAALGAGETVGEVELVLCRKVTADAIAVRGTVTLFLPREEFFVLVQEYPAVLYALYAIAVRRHNETQLALQAGSAFVADEFLELHEAGGRAQPPPEPAQIVEVPKVPEAAPPVEAPRVPELLQLRETVLASTRQAAPSAPRATVPLPQAPPIEAHANGAAPHATPHALPAIPVAPTIILQELRNGALSSSAPPPPDTKRSKFPGHSARPDRMLTPTPPPTSLSPTSASLPPSRLPSSRPMSPARQSVRAATLAAVAACFLGGALVVSRDTHWGGTAAAAGVAAREPPTVAPVVPGAGEPEPPAATVAVPQANTAAASTPKVTRQPGAASAPKRSASKAPAVVVHVEPTASPAASLAAAPPAAPAPAPSTTAAAPVAEAKAAVSPRADDDEFGGRK